MIASAPRATAAFLHLLTAGLLLGPLPFPSAAQTPWTPPRCEVVPLPAEQVSFQLDGIERARWHCGGQYPRPFLFPLTGPSGRTLTRMGHPGAPNHDHHRSIWFAHHSVNGVDFWSDGGAGRVRQMSWYAYCDGGEEAVMASLLAWCDEAGRAIMEQDLVIAIAPREAGGAALEIQATFRPAAGNERVELGKTNFGFLAVRVASSLSGHFGGGQLTDSEGRQGEAAIFGQPARWVDYSGPVAAGLGAERRAVTEGITYFDHPENPRYPTAWHVREDGWMGASFCLGAGWTIATDQPLTLRYLLLAHAGSHDPPAAAAEAAAFADRPGFEIARSTQPHRQFTVARRR